MLGAREPIPRRDRTCGVFGRSVRLQSGCEVRRDGRGGGRAGEGRAGAAMCPGCSRFRQHRCLAHPPGLQQPEGTREAPCLPQSVCPVREGAGRSGTCQGDISLLGLDVPVCFSDLDFGHSGSESTKVLLLMDVPSVPQVRYVLMGPRVVPACGYSKRMSETVVRQNLLPPG